MLQRIWLFLLVALLSAIGVFATVFGTVRGIVHDQQHRPVSTVKVVLKAEDSEYIQTTQTNTDGEFIFDSVPVGQYKVTVSKSGFATQEMRMTVLSGTAPILHLELTVATQVQSVTVHFRGAARTDGVHHADDAHNTRGDRRNAGRVEIEQSGHDYRLRSGLVLHA